MPTLANLEQKFPVLDGAFRRFSSSRGLFTVGDFLVCDLHALAAAADREPNSAALREGIASVISVIHGQHQPWRSGAELLDDVVQNKRFLATGYHEVDLLLEGGLREGQVTELVGASSSGKTQMCLSIAAHVADQYSGIVLYIDTGNSFSAKRIASALDFMRGKNERKEDKLQRIMNKIFHRCAFDIFSLLEMLRELDLTLVNNKDIRQSLLIVDSISSLVTPILGSKNSHGRSLMVSTGCLLKKLAFEHNIAVLVINHMVAGEGGASKPALGESWKTVANVRLLISRDQGSCQCNMSILKHSLKAMCLSAKFLIHEDQSVSDD